MERRLIETVIGRSDERLKTRGAACHQRAATRGLIEKPLLAEVKSSGMAHVGTCRAAIKPRPGMIETYSAASLSFLSARALIRTDAGLASNQRSSPVKGSLPKRRFLAGTFSAEIFSSPGKVNAPAPRL